LDLHVFRWKQYSGIPQYTWIYTEKSAMFDFCVMV